MRTLIGGAPEISVVFQWAVVKMREVEAAPVSMPIQPTSYAGFVKRLIFKRSAKMLKRICIECMRIIIF